MLADKMEISASSVQHHIGKLLSLGLLELHHTKQINGITARFYKLTYALVQIGLERDDPMASQREVYLQEKVARTYDGFIAQKKSI
jgi:predicted ArsR family transcriptional regulator